MLLLMLVPVAWRWTPLSQWINFDTVLDWQQSMKSSPLAWLWVMGAYVVGSLALFPVMVLNATTVFTFGPWWGNAYALAGWLASAGIGYGIGRATGHRLAGKVSTPRLERCIRQAERHGFWAVLTLRILPVAPFSLVNVFVGASGIQFRDFFLATLIGRLPGIVMLSLAGVQLERALRDPGLGSFLLVALPLVILPVVTAWLFKRLDSRDSRAICCSRR